MSDQAAGKPLSSRQDVLSFLDDLDTKFSTPGAKKGVPASVPGDAPSTGSSAPIAQPDEAQSVLDFLDEITQRSSTPTASLPTKKPPNPALASTVHRPLSIGAPRISVTEPSGRKSTDSVRSTRSFKEPEPTPSPALEPAHAAGGGGWGWSSVFRQASTVLQQAKTVAEQARTAAEVSDLVKNLNQGIQQQISGQGENAKKWGEGVMNYVKASGIDQLGKDLSSSGLKSLTDIINAVAPPISEHEIIEVQLSYDMIGYDGIETLVYRSLFKVMEQVEGGDLVLNRGEEEKPKELAEGESERDLQVVDGLTEGYRLAQANLDQLIKRKYKPEPKADGKPAADASSKPSNTVPITRCPVFVRIQPILAHLPTFSSSSSAASPTPSTTPSNPLEAEKHLFFLLLLRDPTNELSHATLTQSMPAVWLDIPFEENEWVEDVMVEVIRRGTEVIGQQYVNGRLTGRSIKNAANRTSLEGARPKVEEAAAAGTSS